MEKRSASRTPGRPRNAATDGRVLAVARELVSRLGYPAVTMAGIASEAGVAKQTLYRRWSSKAELVLEAFLASASDADDVAYDGLQSTLARFLTGLFSHLGRDGVAIRSLIASAQADPGFLALFRSRFAQPRAAALTAILVEARDRAELPSDADLGLLCEMIHGAFWYRLLLGERLDAAYAVALAASAVGASGAPAPGPKSR